MKRTLERLICLGGLLVLTSVASATDPIWVNNGTITVAPQVDATTVINNGIINIFTTEPFSTANTLNYTNKGTMSGAVGFEFSLNPSDTGVSRLAANFNNRLGGVIAAQPADVIITPDGYEALNYLYVDSTNLLNQGILNIEAGGEMVLNGVNLDLSRGGTGVEALFGIGSFNNQPSDGVFLPDISIDDFYWGQDDLDFFSGQIANQAGPLLVAISPSHPVQTAFGGGNTTVVLLNPEAFAYTNDIWGRTITLTNMDGSTTNFFVATNITRQAVFVDPGQSFETEVRFLPSTTPDNYFQTVAVQLITPSTNLATGIVGDATLYFVDALASDPARGVLTNYVTTITDPGGLTARPASYLLSRLPVFEFQAGVPGNAIFTNNFLYDPDTFTNNFVEGEYAAYSPEIGSLVSSPPPVPGGTVTNLSGRVKIVANGALNLNRARIQANGLLTVNTPHLITSTNAVVDAENLTYELGSTNGNLRIQNLMKESVLRMNGDIYVWSGVWSNQINRVFTNNFEIDPDEGTATQTPVTVAVQVGLHALLLDASGLIDEVPVLVHQLELTSTNVVVDDEARVVEDFLIDGDSFTLNGSLTLMEEAQNWTISTAPTLKHYTNNGILLVENIANFGDDRAVPYLSFMNHGSINAVGQTINSDYCEITGTNETVASLTLISRSAKIETGFLNVGGDLSLIGDVFRFRESLLITLGRLNLSLSATGSLADTGGGAGNEWTCEDGFSMPVKPATGDLLGTTIHSISPLYALVSHTWAGEDRGANASGFENNVALGTLVLEPESTLSDFEFQGSGVANGLYVDVLDLSLLPDYESRLVIAPNLTIYFAASEGVSAEELDGALGGRLQWVRDYAGPNSSVEVLLPNGTTILVNKAFRDSTQIDSDADGLANGFDPSPFDGVQIVGVDLVNPPATGPISIEWQGAAETVYAIEYATNLSSPTWIPFMIFTNSASTNGLLEVVDPNPVGPDQKYYRIQYNP